MLIVWPVRESNPHGVTPRDFKSRAYASSANGPKYHCTYNTTSYINTNSTTLPKIYHKRTNKQGVFRQIEVTMFNTTYDIFKTYW